MNAINSSLLPIELLINEIQLQIRKKRFKIIQK